MTPFSPPPVDIPPSSLAFLHLPASFHSLLLLLLQLLASAFSIPASLPLPSCCCSLLSIMQTSFGCQHTPSTALQLFNSVVYPNFVTVPGAVSLPQDIIVFKGRFLVCWIWKISYQGPDKRPMHRLLSCPHVSLSPHTNFSLTPSQW